jgi:DNA-binding response OmpR family regulator
MLDSEKNRIPLPRDGRPQVALVEDDEDLLASMLDYLHALDYPAWGVGSAEAFYKQLHTNRLDVLVLDLGLPGEDGLGVAVWAEQFTHLPVIIVSARDRLPDRLAGLAAGADRYLVKPVELAELVANIDAAWRRGGPAAGAIGDERPAGPAWQLDGTAWVLHTPAGRSVRLTGYELALLKCLIGAEGGVVPRSLLLDAVFGRDAIVAPNRLDVLVTRLRGKMRRITDEELPLRTAHGIGYALPGAKLK